MIVMGRDTTVSSRQSSVQQSRRTSTSALLLRQDDCCAQGQPSLHTIASRWGFRAQVVSKKAWRGAKGVYVSARKSTLGGLWPYVDRSNIKMKQPPDADVHVAPQEAGERAGRKHALVEGGVEEESAADSGDTYGEVVEYDSESELFDKLRKRSGFNDESWTRKGYRVVSGGDASGDDDSEEDDDSEDEDSDSDHAGGSLARARRRRARLRAEGLRMVP